MTTLSAAIIKHQVASLGEVEDAMSRQSLYGGDLATNLLEVSTISETALIRVLAGCLELDPAPVGELPRAADATLRLVPAELCEQHGIYPLAEHAGALVVAVSELLPSEVGSDLAFALGLIVIERAALAVRIRQAIARDYRGTLEVRLERLLARLDGLIGPEPLVVPREQRTGSWPLPHPPTVPPMHPIHRASSHPRPHGAPRAARTQGPDPAEKPPTTERLAATHHANQPFATSGSSPSPPTPEAAGTHRRLAFPAVGETAATTRADRPSKTGAAKRASTPAKTGIVAEQLDQATSRDQLLGVLLDLAAQRLQCAVLFLIQGDTAQARDGRGLGAGVRLASISVPLDRPSRLVTVRDSGQTWIGSLTETEIERDLQRQMGRPPDCAGIVLPIMVRGRCVLLLYGDQAGQTVTHDVMQSLVALLPRASAALGRLIIERKLQGRRSSFPAPSSLPSAPPHRPPGSSAGPASGAASKPEAMGPFVPRSSQGSAELAEETTPARRLRPETGHDSSSLERRLVRSRGTAADSAAATSRASHAPNAASIKGQQDSDAPVPLTGRTRAESSHTAKPSANGFSNRPRPTGGVSLSPV
ncbi:hypothetical protein ACFL5O_07960, partial [Myxococcota bacterium]